MLTEGMRHFVENVNDLDTHINMAERAHARPAHTTEQGR